MTSVNREVIIMSRRVDFRILAGVDGSRKPAQPSPRSSRDLGRMQHEFERSSRDRRAFHINGRFFFRRSITTRMMRLRSHAERSHTGAQMQRRLWWTRRRAMESSPKRRNSVQT